MKWWPYRIILAYGTKQYPRIVDFHNDGRHKVVFDDGDKYSIKFAEEKWFHTESINRLSNFTWPMIAYNEKFILKKMFETVGNKSFMRHQSQGFQQIEIFIEYIPEEKKFEKNVSV